MGLFFFIIHDKSYQFLIEIFHSRKNTGDFCCFRIVVAISFELFLWKDCSVDVNRLISTNTLEKLKSCLFLGFFGQALYGLILDHFCITTVMWVAKVALSHRTKTFWWSSVDVVFKFWWVSNWISFHSKRKTNRKQNNV